jgi:hypothetical protein
VRVAHAPASPSCLKPQLPEKMSPTIVLLHAAGAGALATASFSPCRARVADRYSACQPTQIGRVAGTGARRSHACKKWLTLRATSRVPAAQPVQDPAHRAASPRHIWEIHRSVPSAYQPPNTGAAARSRHGLKRSRLSAGTGPVGLVEFEQHDDGQGRRVAGARARTARTIHTKTPNFIIAPAQHSNGQRLRYRGDRLGAAQARTV